MIPTIAAYDPCFAYEIAVNVRDGIRRMYENREGIFFTTSLFTTKITLQAAMPEGSEEGILKGIYLFGKSAVAKPKARVQLFGSGSILTEVIKAQQILGEKYNVAADAWSVTSYNELRREALKVERWNRLHPAEPAKAPYIQQVLEGAEGPIVAASDYMKAVQDQIAAVAAGTLSGARHGWIWPGSENREHLRRHFRKSMRHPSLRRHRWRSWRVTASLIRRRRRRRWSNWGSTRRRSIRRRHSNLGVVLRTHCTLTSVSGRLTRAACKLLGNGKIRKR